MGLFNQKPFNEYPSYIPLDIDTPKCCFGCGLHRPVFVMFGTYWELCYDCKTEARNIGIEEWYRKSTSKEESE